MTVGATSPPSGIGVPWNRPSRRGSRPSATSSSDGSVVDQDRHVLELARGPRRAARRASSSAIALELVLGDRDGRAAAPRRRASRTCCHARSSSARSPAPRGRGRAGAARRPRASGRPCGRSRSSAARGADPRRRARAPRDRARARASSITERRELGERRARAGESSIAISASVRTMIASIRSALLVDEVERRRERLERRLGIAEVVELEARDADPRHRVVGRAARSARGSCSSAVSTSPRASATAAASADHVRVLAVDALAALDAGRGVVELAGLEGVEAAFEIGGQAVLARHGRVHTAICIASLHRYASA